MIKCVSNNTSASSVLSVYCQLVHVIILILTFKSKPYRDVNMSVLGVVSATDSDSWWTSLVHYLLSSSVSIYILQALNINVASFLIHNCYPFSLSSSLYTCLQVSQSSLFPLFSYRLCQVVALLFFLHFSLTVFNFIYLFNFQVRFKPYYEQCLEIIVVVSFHKYWIERTCGSVLM